MLPTRLGALIPAYYSPTSANFNTIISQKNAHPNVPVAVVLNPSGSGVGTTADPAFTTLMTNLRNAGIFVLGYVYTNFGEETELNVQAEIEKWWSFYNTGTTISTRRVNGIYFAAMSNQSSKQTYYSNLQTYAKVTRGFNATAGSAGTTVPISFLNSTCADTIVVYEGVGVPLPQNYSQYDASLNSNIGLIPYGIGSINIEWLRQISAFAGWLYMTSDSGINPYDSLPSYFATFMTELDLIGAAAAGGGGAPVTDNFGIKKIYHTKSGGEEWYVNRSNPTSDPRLQNVPPLTPNADGSWSHQGSSPDYFVRLEAWSPAYTDTTQRINAKWRNVEITGYIKIEQEFNTQTYLCQWYSRGGHHGSANRCEGSALKSRLYMRATSGALRAGFVKELCHSDYANNQGVVSGAVPYTGSGFYNRWIGLKHVIYNVVESGNTYTKQEFYADIDVQDSSGNLVINNNWKFLTSYVDRGGWCTSGTSCEPDCPVGQCTIHTAPGGNTTSGHSNFNRNLCAWRTDGTRARWDYLTTREIDPTQPAAGDGGTLPPAPPPSPDPPSSFDNFGVRKVHPTKAGGNEWYMASTPTSDARFNLSPTGFSITNNTDGSYKINNSTVIQKFINVYQPNGYNSGLTATNSQNHGQCAQQGFMQDISDWRNIEMTGYFRVISEISSGNCEICLFGRGGRHLDPQPNCEGSSMKGFLQSNGGTRFAKEQYHAAYNYTLYTNQINSSIVNRWIGFKYVVYNRNVSGTNIVKQEIYVDNNNDNTWIKVDEKPDAGGWGVNGVSPCNGFTNDQLIIWGGPIATFRLDNIVNIDFKQLSVREIDADAISQEPPPPQPGETCGS